MEIHVSVPVAHAGIKICDELALMVGGFLVGVGITVRSHEVASAVAGVE